MRDSNGNPDEGSEGYLDTTGFRSERIDLDDGSIENMHQIHQKISRSSPISKDLKKELAVLFLDIIEENDVSRNTIKNYGRLFLTFNKFSFKDELDGILKETQEIVKNAENVNFPAFTKWKNLKNKLNEYLG